MKVAIDKELNLNKSSWKPVKFGDVVTEPKESTRDIVGDGFKHIVGLEHIDTENIHLKRWMEVGGETTFSKVFRKGDVLFGRRRAYLKKAALANFDGVCSGDITVFRTKSNLIPELLPFIVNNERFFDYAIKHSAGGLSPRVKFKDLANFEFLLPAKEEQKKLAELLWAMDDVIEKKKNLLQIVLNFKEIKITDLFEKGKKSKSIQIKELYKKRVKSVMPNDIANETVNHYSLPSYLLNQQPEVIPGNKLKSNKILIEYDTILFSKLNPHRPKIWHVQPSTDYISVGSTEWLPVFPNEEISTSFLEAYFSSMKFQNNIMRFVQGSSNSHKRIDPPKFYNTEIPIFSKHYIKEIEEIFEVIQKIIKSLEVEIKSSQSLQKSLINQMF